MQPYSLYVYCSPSPANIDLAVCLVSLWTSLTLAFSPAILPQADSLCSIRDCHTCFETIPLIWDEQCETHVAYTEKGQGWRKTKYLPKIDMRNRSEQAGKNKEHGLDHPFVIRQSSNIFHHLLERYPVLWWAQQSVFPMALHGQG